jgi:HK97 family phage major capsid protein
MDIRAHVVKLNEQRINVIEQIRGELIATQGRDRSGEESAKIERMEADCLRIKNEIDEFVAIETRAVEAAQLRQAQESVFGAMTTNYSTPIQPVDELRAFLRGNGGQMSANGGRFMEIDIAAAKREMDIIRMGGGANELRALAWDTGSSGSLVPTTLARTLYQILEASISVYRMGTTKISTGSGENLVFPKLTTHAVATQVSGQGTALAGSDPVFAKVTLGAFKYGELVRVANEVLADSGIDLGPLLGADMGRALARKIGTDITTGTGTGQPTGIMTAIVGSGTIATGGSLVTVGVNDLLNLKYSVNDMYRQDPSCAWLMNDSTAGTIAKLRDGGGGTVGAFLWRPSLTAGLAMGTPDMLFDKPVYIDTNVAAQGSNAKSVWFGAASAFYIRTVGNPIIETDGSRYFDSDEVGFRAKWRVDSNYVDLTAANVIKQSV